MAKIAESCSRYSMTNPPEKQYQSGYEIGLRKYCTPELGLAYGVEGKSVPRVCTARSAHFPELMASWSQGIDTYCSAAQGQSSAENGEAPNEFCTENKHRTYFQGFAKGAAAYCQNAGTAFQRGKSGQVAFTYCPSQLASAFGNAYSQGAAIFAQAKGLRKEINQLDNRISRLNDEDREAERKIERTKRRVSSIKYDISSMESRIRSIESDISSLERRAESDSDYRRLSSLRDDLRRLRNNREDLHQERANLNDKLPELFHKRTILAVEVTTAKYQREQLKRELAVVEAKEFNS